MNLKRDKRVCHTKSKVTVLDFYYGNKGLVEYISKEARGEIVELLVDFIKKWSLLEFSLCRVNCSHYDAINAYSNFKIQVKKTKEETLVG